jgi:UDP-glucose 4-epimerase
MGEHLDNIGGAVITGPTGAVGTALIEELVAQGIHVVAVCRRGSRRIFQLPRDSLVRVIECNLDEYDSLPALVGSGYDVFFHLAWDGTSGPSRQDWALQEENVRHAMDAVRAAREIGCKVFVGVGSQSEAGHVDGVLRPDGICRPDNGYGAAKLAACDLTRAFCSFLGIRHEWCRIVSVYGPRDRSGSLVMGAIDTLEKHEHLSCTPCDQIWDYIYSADAARALRLVAERGHDAETYYIASGSSRPLREFVCDIRDIVDPTAEIGFGEIPYYPNQVMHLEVDISNLVEHTGFACEVSFREGIRRTIEWQRTGAKNGREENR